MKRTVRPSPYQVADLRNVASVPRPLYRKVVFINPFQASRQGLEVVAPGSSAAAPGSATSVVGQYWAGKGELGPQQADCCVSVRTKRESN